ncbi:LuxR C-terminal-related transcriptional regulator [Bradyrhizobium canariense]|uniref:LuxR C-terminal-related transcriptional regulator n=1 Tax=Bradyrhizobium canariense TaxID=255045 RepID=UPI0032DE969A
MPRDCYRREHRDAEHETADLEPIVKALQIISKRLVAKVHLRLFLKKSSTIAEPIEAPVPGERTDCATARSVCTSDASRAEVMALVASGLMNKQIANELSIGETAVKMHRGSVMRKLTAKSVAMIAWMAEAIDIRT